MQTIKNKYLVAAILFVIGVILTSIFNGESFQASIIKQDVQTSSADLYIDSSYSALSEDEGEIDIMVGNSGMNALSVLSFVLKYPAEKISFFDTVSLGNLEDNQGNSIEPEMLAISPDNSKGEALVDLVSTEAFSLLPNTKLMSLRVKIDSDVQIGEELTIEFQKVEAIDTNYSFKALKTESGKITISSKQEELKVLSSNMIEPGVIEVEFNDYLTSASLPQLRNLLGGPFALDPNSMKISEKNGKKLVLMTEDLSNKPFQVLQSEIKNKNNKIYLAKNTQVSASEYISANTEITITAAQAELIANQKYQTVNSDDQVALKANTLARISNNTLLLSAGTDVYKESTLSSGTGIELSTQLSSIKVGQTSLSLAPGKEIIVNQQTMLLSKPSTVSISNFSTFLKESVGEISAGQLDLPAGSVLTWQNGEYRLYADTDVNGLIPAGTPFDISLSLSLDQETRVSYEETLSSDIELMMKENQELVVKNVNFEALSARNSLSPDSIYQLDFTNTIVSGNSKKLLSNTNSLTYFSGISEGNIELKSASSISKSQVLLEFSSMPTSSLATNPTKYLLLDSEGKRIGIKEVTLNQASASLELSKSLTNDEYYFLIAKDLDFVSNNRSILFQASLKQLTQVLSTSKSSISKDGSEVVFSGVNLTEVVSIIMDDKELEIISQEESSIVVSIPSQEKSGLKSLEFELKNGNKIVKDNFISVIEPSAKLEVLSEESYASPKRVINDGQTETTLWAVIQDPRGVGAINKVTLDLREIGGSAVAPMIGEDENGEAIIVDDKRLFFLKTVVPATVKTSETPKEIRVTAEDPYGQKAYGEISLIVSRNIISSEVPEILEAYASPTQIMVETPLSFHAYIKDLDGINDIDSVVFDLGSLGIGPRKGEMEGERVVENSQSYSRSTQVSSENNSSEAQSPITINPSSEITNRWYSIKDVIIPNTVKAGTHDIQVIVTDKSGEEGRKTITISLSRGNSPQIDGERTESTPREEVPNDGKEKFSVVSYISDEDGIDDITAVNIDLQEIGGTVVEMDMQGEQREGQKGAWFIAKDLSVSKETLTGIVSLNIYAYDKQGNEAEYRHELKVTSFDELGDAPEIDSSRSYTSPAAVTPDEETRITLNAFINKHEFEVTQVMVDLGNIAKHVGDISASSSDAENSCLGATERIICMTPGIQEGAKGQWYYLEDVVVLKSTPSSLEPYRVRVNVTDEKGKSSSGFIFINVGDGTLPTYQTGFPKVQMAISTSANSIEVMFSNPIDPKKVKTSAFKITSSSDTSEQLSISRSSVNSSATVATLETGSQEPGKSYTLFADAQQLGLKESQYTDNHADFVGFSKREIPPQIAKITAISPNLIEVIFSEGLRPSSVKAHGSDFEIFTHEQQPERLGVKHVEFRDDNQTLRISTDTQESEKKYQLRVKNIFSAAGVKVGGNDRPQRLSRDLYFGIHKTFIGYASQAPERKSIIESVDFDKNGKIDFTDFTIFSSVYGESLVNPINNPENSETGFSPTPLEGTSKASIPSTSPVE